MTIAATRSQGSDTPRQVDLSGPRNLLNGLYLEMSAEIDEAVATAAAITGAGERFGGDEGDTGLRSAQRDQEITVLASLRARRKQIERALARVEAGTYGLCETCGEQIPVERLEAFPAVTECVGCRRTTEMRD
jgi:DnaK suppressor protein